MWFDLPETSRLLVGGQISEYVASLVVSETRHLDARTRREVDAKISAAGISQNGAAQCRGLCPAGMPRRRIRSGMCNAAGPNGRTVG